MSTMKPGLPVTIERIVPRIAGPTRIAVRVWMRPRTVGHISSGPSLATSRKLLRHAHRPDRVGAAVGERELHREPGNERAPAQPLRARVVGDEAAADVLEPGDGVAVGDD